MPQWWIKSNLWIPHHQQIRAMQYFSKLIGEQFSAWALISSEPSNERKACNIK
jgi:hypothetical protein